MKLEINFSGKNHINQTGTQTMDTTVSYWINYTPTGYMMGDGGRTWEVRKALRFDTKEEAIEDQTYQNAIAIKVRTAP